MLFLVIKLKKSVFGRSSQFFMLQVTDLVSSQLSFNKSVFKKKLTWKVRVGHAVPIPGLPTASPGLPHLEFKLWHPNFQIMTFYDKNLFSRRSRLVLETAEGRRLYQGGGQEGGVPPFLSMGKKLKFREKSQCFRAQNCLIFKRNVMKICKLMRLKKWDQVNFVGVQLCWGVFYRIL